MSNKKAIWEEKEIKINYKGDSNLIVYFYGSIIASVILYINIVTIIRKIKNNENTDADTVLGCVCIAFITFSFLSLCMR